MEIDVTINFWAVLSSAVSAFVLGGIWYGPLFGKRWQALNGLSDEQIAGGNTAMIFGVSFLLTFVVAFALAILVGSPLLQEVNLVNGIILGLEVSVLFVATSMGINYLFALKPFSLWLVDCGYLVLMFAVMGAILGAWQ